MGSDVFALVAGALRLSAIFNDGDSVFTAQLQEIIQGDRLSIEVYGDEGLSFGGDFLFGFTGAQEEIAGLQVAENRFGAAESDRFGRCNGSMDGGDDFSTGFDSETLHGRPEGSGAASSAANRFDTHPPSHVGLENFDIGAFDVGSTINNTNGRFMELFSQRKMKAANIDKFNWFHTGDVHGRDRSQ